jgi:hypothetical protein
MRSCRWALPFGDVPMHPTCADCSIGQRVNSCQLRTNQDTYYCAAFTYFCRMTSKPSILAFSGRTAHGPFETPFGSHLFIILSSDANFSHDAPRHSAVDLHLSSLPRRARRGQHFLDTHVLHRFSKVIAEDSIANHSRSSLERDWPRAAVLPGLRNV